MRDAGDHGDIYRHIRFHYRCALHPPRQKGPVRVADAIPINEVTVMLKKTIIVLLSVLCIFAAWTIGSGFIVRTDVYVKDFAVSDDGGKLILTVGVASPMGYVRGLRDEGGGVKPHYLKFYSAWGGFNSSLGAAGEYTLVLHPDDTEVFFYRGGGGYSLELYKDGESGEWRRAK